MRNIYFGDFRLLVIQHIKDIDGTSPDPYSVEWFLLSYLRRIVKVTTEPAMPGRVDSCIRAMIRFYLDNVDDKSDLGDRCARIYDEYRKTVRLSQEKES